MKNKKLMSLLLAMVLVFTACNSQTNNQTTEGETSAETAAEEVQGLDDVKDVEDLRAKKDKFITVDGEEVSYSKFYQFYDLYAGIFAMGRNLSTELTNLFVLDKIVSEELEAANIEVTQEEIDNEINLYIQNLGSQGEFSRYLSLLGVSKETFEENIVNSIKNQKYKEYIESNVEITEEEKNAYYEANKDSLDYVVARHILVENQETAQRIVERLKAGEDFVELSNEFSIDEAAKSNGGNLGRVTRNQFDPDFVDAAYQLEVGAVSEPVQTQFGYHIIEVTESGIGAEAHSAEIEAALKTQKYTEHVQQKIDEADVKLYDFDGNEIVEETQGEVAPEAPVETTPETTEETTAETTQETAAETTEETAEESTEETAAESTQETAE